MVVRDPRNIATPRDPAPLLDARHPSPFRRSLVAPVAAVVAIVLLLGYGAFLLSRPEEQPESYATVEELAAAIHSRVGGCRNVAPSLSSLPGQQAGVCRIDGVPATLTVYDDPSMVRPADAPPPSEGITWVVGPNWVVATDRARARLVGDATGGRVVAA